MSPSYMKRIRNFLKRTRACTANPAPRLCFYRPGLERLEDRLAPATFTWNNPTGGDWDTVSNWSVGGSIATVLPGPSDNVVINNLNAGASVTHAVNMSDGVNSVTATAPITLSAGTLSVAGNFSNSSIVTLAGGTLANATVAAGTLLQGYGGLSGVALNGTLNENVFSSSVTVTNGLTLGSSGLVETTNVASLIFSGNQSLAGTGEVLFSVGTNANSEINVEGGSTLTIAAGITIDGLNATITADGSGDAIDNFGTLSVGSSKSGTASGGSLSGGTFNIEGAWINEPASTTEAVNDGHLAFIAAGGYDPGGNPITSGVWMNDAGATISVTGNSDGGGGLSLEGNGWSNAGTIAMTDSSVFLGGTFTLAALGTLGTNFTRDVGTVYLSGTLNSTGTTLALNNTTGSWELDGGTINGGTITTSGTAVLGAQTIVNDTTGTLNDVTLAGEFDDTASVFNPVKVTGNLTLNAGTVEIGNASTLIFSGNQSLAGTGEVLFSVGTNANSEINVEGGSTLTIAAGITIDGLNATITADGSGDAIDNFGTLSVGSSKSGTASGGSLSGGTFNIEGAWINEPASTTEAVNDGHLAFIAAGGYDPGGNPITSGVWMNDAGATISVTGNSDGGGGLSLEGNGWSNAGTIAMTDSSVFLGGTFTLAALGTLGTNFTRDVGTVYLSGTLNSTGTTLALNNTTGSWELDGGTINGGTITTSGTAVLGAQTIVNDTTGTLNDVTLAGEFDDTASVFNPVKVTGNLTLNTGTVEIGNASTLSFVGSQSLFGTGEVLFSDSNSSNNLDIKDAVADDGSALTISPNITIEGNTGTLSTGSSDAIFISYATISDDTQGGSLTLTGDWTNNGTLEASADGTLTVAASSFINEGTVEASTDGSVTVNPTNFVNFSAGTLYSGMWEAASGGVLRLIGDNITTNNADIVLDGTASNVYGLPQILSGAGGPSALAGFTTNESGGDFTLQNGETFNATQDFTNAGTVNVNFSLFNINVAGGTYTQTAGATYLADNGVLGTDGDQVIIQGGVLSGSGTIACSLVNSAEVDLGANPGILEVATDYTQTSAGTLTLKVGGTTAGTQFDQVIVSGTATFAGTLTATLINSYVPSPGLTFPVIAYGNTSGSFATFNSPEIDGVPVFTTQTNPTVLDLLSASAPSPPAAPTNFVVTGVTATSIAFSWTDNDSIATGYDVWQAIAGSTNFTPVSDSPFGPGTDGATVTGLTSGVTYQFEVRADNGAGSSDWLVSGDVQTLISTATSVSGDPNPAVLVDPAQDPQNGPDYVGFGAITFTAMVINTSGTSDIPVGTVDFEDATTGVDLGTVSLSNGSASIDGSFLALGTHTIVATYIPGPASNFAGSADSTSEAVEADTSTTVTAAPAPGILGQPVTFSASVQNELTTAGIPTGAVQFQVDGINYGQPVALDQNGQASITDPSLPLGSHAITANYLPSTVFASSQGTVTEAVDIADFWTGNAGDDHWDTPGNWSDGVPEASYDVYMSDLPVGTVITLGPADVANNVFISSPGTFAGGDLTAAALLSDSAPLTLANGATLQAPEPFVLEDVTVQQGSTLSGSGTVQGNMVNDGEVDLGSEIGRLQVDGNYTQGPNAALRLKVGGPIQSDNDQFNIAGTATLAGTLNVVLTSSWTGATVGDELSTVTSAHTLEGSFSTLNVPMIDGSPIFNVTNTPGGILMLMNPLPPSAAINYTGIPQWQPEGPAPTNTPGVGAIESIVVGGSAATGYIVYAGTVNGGVWRSDNIVAGDFTTNPSVLPSTVSWTPLTDNQSSLAVTSMALDPTDPSGNTLWVATGSLSSADEGGGPRTGLLLTTNGGATWTPMGQDLVGQLIASIVPTGNFDTDGEIILVASENGGILRSNNGGQSFITATNITNFLAPTGTPLTGSATALVQDPTNSSIFYAALADQGIFESTDDGSTWFEIDDAIAQFTQADGLKLAVTSSGGTTNLFVVTEKNGVITGASVAQPVGVNFPEQPVWQAITPSTGLPQINADTFAGHFGVVADPTDPNVIYLGTYQNNDWRIDASNDTWTNLFTENNTTPHGDERSLVFLNSTTLLVSDDGGIYGLTNPLSPGSGDIWVNLNGNLQDTEFFAVAYDSIDGLIFGGSQDNGTLVQASSGSLPWNGFGGGDGGNVAVDSSGSQSVYYYFDDDDFGSKEQTASGLSSFHRAQLAAAPGGALYSGLNAADQVFMGGIPPTAITGATGTPIVISTASTGDLTNGDQVVISGVGGDSAANATWTVSNVTATSFTLDGTTSNGPYTGGGTWQVNGNAGGEDNSFLVVVNTLTDVSPQPILLGGGALTGIYESSTPVTGTNAFGVGDVIVNVTPTDMVGNVSAITYAAGDGTAYFGTNTGQLFLRDGGSGVSFQPIPTPSSWQTDGKSNGTYAVQIVADPNDPYMVYLLDNKGNVWRSTGGGKNGWTALTGNLSLTNLDSLSLYNPSGNSAGSGVLLVAGFGGVERLTLQPGNFTPNWSSYGQGLPNVQVTDVQYVPLNTATGFGDLVLVGTLGRGAWEIPNASTTLTVPAQVTITAANGTIVLRSDPARPYNAQLLMGGPGASASQVIQADNIQMELPWVSSLGITAAAETVDILNVPNGVSVTVTAAATTVVNVGSTDNTLAGIQGNIAVDGTAAANGDYTLNIDDQGDTNATTWAIGQPSIGAPAAFSGTINYEGVYDISVNGGSGGNTFNVNDTTSDETLTLNTGSAQGSIQNQVYVIAWGSESTLDINDASATKLQVESTGVGSATNIRSQNDDFIRIGNSGVVTDILGTVNIESAPIDGDTLRIDDEDDNASQTVTVSNDAVDFQGLGDITYAADTLQTLLIYGSASAAGSTWTVQSTTAPDSYVVLANGESTPQIAGSSTSTLGLHILGTTTTVIECDGPDMVNVGALGSMQNIQGTLDVLASSMSLGVQLNLDDTATSYGTPNWPVSVDATSVTGLGGLVAGNPSGNFGTTVNYGAGVFDLSDNSLDVSPGGFSALTVNPGAGCTVTMGSMVGQPVGMSIAVNAFINGNTLIGPNDGPNTTVLWQFQQVNNQVLDYYSEGNDAPFVNFSGMDTLQGGSGPNYFQFLGDASFSGTIDGGNGGNNTLDLSQYLGQSLSVFLTQDGSENGLQGTAAAVGTTFDNIDSLIGNPAEASWFAGSNPGNPFQGDFTATLSVQGFANMGLDVTGDFTGTLLAKTEGIAADPIGLIEVQGNVQAGAVIEVGFLQTFQVDHDMDGAIEGFGDDTVDNPPVPSIGDVFIDGSVGSSALLQAYVVGSVQVTLNMGGVLKEQSLGDFQSLTIGGDFESTGLIDAASAQSVEVDGAFDGTAVFAGSVGSLQVINVSSGTVVVGGTMGTVQVGGQTVVVGGPIPKHTILGGIDFEPSVPTVNIAPGDVTGLIQAIDTANNITNMPSVIDLAPGSTYVLSEPDNDWYGPNGLPAVTSNITINGNINPDGSTSTSGAVIERAAGATPFRIFYVSGGEGFDSLPAGTLTLNDLTIEGGLAQGGNGGNGYTPGGGGAGLGGAIFSQGTLDLNGVTLTQNTAQGGNAGIMTSNGGGGGGGGGLGGNGGDGYTNDAVAALGYLGDGGGGGGGGFASAGTPGGSYFGGAGGAGATGGGGGLGEIEINGYPATSGATGGGGGGGAPPSVTVLGATSESAPTATGSGGDGGIGGGGGGAGYGFGSINAGDGGFGGGGGGESLGGTGGNGGFGGGGGGGVNGPGGDGGFGAGSGGKTANDQPLAGGGAGMGGAIFNMSGSLTITNSTFALNTAQGGSPSPADGNGGDGLGAAVFNLNGTVTLVNDTLADNDVIAGANALAEGRDVYNLALNVSIPNSNPVTATVNLTNDILSGTGDDVFNLFNDAEAGTSSASTNVLGTSLVQLGVNGTVSGLSNLIDATTDPMLGLLQNNGGPTHTMEVLAGSPLLLAANSGVLPSSDPTSPGYGVPTTDQRGVPRGNTINIIGAYQATDATQFGVTGFPDGLNNQLANAGTSYPFTVTAEDQFGKTVYNYTGTVSVQSTDPAASFLPSSQTIMAANNGVAMFEGMLDTPGVQAITAGDGTIVGDEVPIVVGTAPQPAAQEQISVFSGSGQSATVSTQFAQPLVALVTQNGVPVAGATVTFVLGSNDNVSGIFPGAADSDVETTLADGEATSQFITADPLAGTWTVTATTPGALTPAVFDLTNTAAVQAPTQLVYAAGAAPPPSVTTSQAFAFNVDVEDASGNVVTNDSSTVTATITGPEFPSGETIPEPVVDGKATFSGLSLSQTGTYTLTIADPENGGLAVPPPVTITVPLPSNQVPAKLVIIAGNNQDSPINTAYQNALVVEVEDASGNPIANMYQVQFAAPTSGASVTFPSTIVPAGAGGEASDLPIANAVEGSVSITASLVNPPAGDTVEPVSFTLSNTDLPKSIEFIGKPNTTATVGTAFGSPLPEVEVFDGANDTGNPVGGVTVTFALPGSGAGATTSGSLTVTTGLKGTATFGMALVPALVANTVAGSWTLDASVSGVTSPATLAMTNSPGAFVALDAINASGQKETQESQQSTIVGTAFATPLIVEAVDEYGNGVKGVSVKFAGPTTGASVSFSKTTVTTATTTLNGQAIVGVAEVAATANTVASTTAYSAYATASTSSGTAEAAFGLANTPGPFAKLVYISGSGQSATVGTAFKAPLIVEAEDQYGNGIVSNLPTVTFTAPSTGASATFSSPGAVSGKPGQIEVTATANHIASPSTLEAQPTPYTVSASAILPSGKTTAVTPQGFSLTNTPGAPIVTVSSGSGQTVTNAETFTALVTKVADQYGNPISGTTVTFTVNVLSGTNSYLAAFAGKETATTTTNGSGIATAPTLTALDTRSGTFTVTPSVSGGTTASSFSLTVEIVDPEVSPPQSATVGQAYAQPLKARVSDAAGPLADVPVTFTASASGPSGTFEGQRSVTVRTNADGVATAPALTANMHAGCFQVMVVTQGVAGPDFISMTNLPGPAAKLTVVSGSPQLATVNTGFDAPLVARVTDRFGNPVAGVTVTFTAPVDGFSGTFAGNQSTFTLTTNSLGLASTPTFTANTKAGTYSVVASVSGIAADLSYKLTNVASPPVYLIVGPSQSAVIGDNYSHPLTATVTDAYGNPIRGVAVTFTMPESGASGIFGRKQTVMAITNADGIATAPMFTANTETGNFLVDVSVLGLSTSFIQLTNLRRPT